jgi:hypothetical protein
LVHAVRSQVVLISIFSALIAVGAMAQQVDEPRVSPSEPPVPPTFAEPPSVAAMEEPQPGDYWTFESRDEITGKLTSPRTTTVTEVTPTEISVRVSAPAGSDLGFSVYDRSWNRKSAGVWTYSPNDGQGIKSPLQVGTSWAFKSDSVESEHGIVWVRKGSSKILAREKIMTKAGLFDTLLIETTYSLRRTNDTGNNNNEIRSRSWYAPAIDHWVRRTVTARTDGHLRSNTTLELIAYGRKQ